MSLRRTASPLLVGLAMLAGVCGAQMEQTSARGREAREPDGKGVASRWGVVSSGKGMSGLRRGGAAASSAGVGGR